VGLSCVPMTVVLEIATAMREGAQKYGRHNWREAGVRSSVYFDAAIRHLFAWWEGEEIDPDSGISHLTKAIASLVVLRDGQMQSETQPELFNDDRPVNHVKHLVTKMNTKISDKAIRDMRPRPFLIDLSTGEWTALDPKAEPKEKMSEPEKLSEADGPQTSLASSAGFRYISDMIHRTTMESALELREAFESYNVGGFFFRKQENLLGTTMIMHSIASYAEQIAPERVKEMFKVFAQHVEARIEVLETYRDPLNSLGFKRIKNELVSHIDERRREILVSSLRGRTPVVSEHALEAPWYETARRFLADLTEENRELCLQKLQKVAVGSQDHLYNTREYALLRNRLVAIPTRYALNLVDGLESELTTGVQFIPSKIDDKDLYQRLLGLLRRFNKESRSAHLADLRKVAIRLDNSQS
jgi:hypothetical protein